MTLKDEFPRLIGAQYATGYQWRIISEVIDIFPSNLDSTTLESRLESSVVL